MIVKGGLHNVLTFFFLLTNRKYLPKSIGLLLKQRAISLSTLVRSVQRFKQTGKTFRTRPPTSFQVQQLWCVTASLSLYFHLLFREYNTTQPDAGSNFIDNLCFYNIFYLHSCYTSANKKFIFDDSINHNTLL